jgi:hypothetical protein
MFLTRAQIRELTGAATRAKQIDVLKRNGVPFIVNAAGWPVVTVSAVEGRRGPEAVATAGWHPAVLGV